MKLSTIHCAVIAALAKIYKCSVCDERIRQGEVE